MVKIKIAVRGGHNFQATGASGLIDETTEDRKVKDSVIKYLQELGHTVLDVTPGNMDVNSDLVYGVSRANNWGADLFISIHFNKAYNSYNGAIGAETWIYSKNDNFNDEVYAKRIIDGLAKAGFKNRGVKTSTELYELKSTTMPSIIIEVCFVEATEDVALYKKLGADYIGNIIASAINGDEISGPSTEEKEKIKVDYIIQYSNSTDQAIAEVMADRLNCPTINCLRPYAFYSEYKNVIAIGEGKNKSGYTNVEIKGTDRKETLDLAIAYCKKLGK